MARQDFYTIKCQKGEACMVGATFSDNGALNGAIQISINNKMSAIYAHNFKDLKDLRDAINQFLEETGHA